MKKKVIAAICIFAIGVASGSFATVKITNLKNQREAAEAVDSENEIDAVDEYVQAVEQEQTMPEVEITEGEQNLAPEVGDASTGEYPDIQIEMGVVSTTPLTGIVCWGDSLTYGFSENSDRSETFPRALQANIDANYGSCDVVNLGANGESSLTIAGRAGGIPYKNVEGFVIPADCSEVRFHIQSADGRNVYPSALTDVGINTCNIMGVDGELHFCEINGDEATYSFRRNNPGSEVAVDAGTYINTYAWSHYQDYASVVFVGANGGYECAEDLIYQIKSIIVSRTSNTDRFIVIGLIDGGNEDNEINAKLAEAFGDKFVDAKAYLLKKGMIAIGAEPTEEDNAAIADNRIPPSMKSDEVHLTEATYGYLGFVVYERMVALGYFNYN